MPKAPTAAPILCSLLWLLLWCAGPVQAQSVITATSDPSISIHSTFSGQTITLFGNVEPDVGGTLPPGPYDVVVVLRGPVADRVVRFRSRQLGVIVNSDYAFYENLPSFYRVLSSRPVEDLASPEVLADNLLTLDSLARQALTEVSGPEAVFDAQLLRLMEEEGLFAAHPRGVQFLSPTFFAARVALPANVPNGSYLAQTLVFANGEIAASRASRFVVRTEGFERFVAESARDLPVVYGILTVLLALVTGWVGGVLFRR